MKIIIVIKNMNKKRVIILVIIIIIIILIIIINKKGIRNSLGRFWFFWVNCTLYAFLKVTAMKVE